MSLYDELLVFKASYDLLLDIFQFTANFKREYKYTVGEKLKNETLALILLVTGRRRYLQIAGKLINTLGNSRVCCKRGAVEYESYVLLASVTAARQVSALKAQPAASRGTLANIKIN